MLPTIVDQALDDIAKLRSHRERVVEIENEMRKHTPRIIEIKHHFGHGVYAREAYLPKDTLATGHIHKFEQINIISKGDISVLTENGAVRLKAPATIVSPPGTKRLVYAHEDTVFTTIIGTHETDIEKLEGELVAETEHDYTRHLEQFEKLVEIT